MTGNPNPIQNYNFLFKQPNTIIFYSSIIRKTKRIDFKKRNTSFLGFEEKRLETT